jgi:hypothetical protein
LRRPLESAGVVAVGRRHVAAPSTGLEIVLAYQPSDHLVIEDHAPMPKLGANAPPAIEFELLADCGDRLDDRRAVTATRRDEIT